MDSFSKTYWIFIVVAMILILLVGVLFRSDTFDLSLTHDEVAMANFAESVLKFGIPVRPVDRFSPLTTYELLPYPIALSVLIFGQHDWAIRLPAILFSLATTVLIFYIGKRLWNVRVGLWASVVFSLSPFSIICGAYAFHPQQTQFLALLTSFWFYIAIQPPEKIATKYIYMASFGFIATYLSWEGSGFLLPAFFICLLVKKKNDFRWIKDKHLWIAVLLAALLVILQLSNRILWKTPYIAVGREFGTFAFLFLDILYDPFYYLENFFFIGSHTLITIGGIIGVLIGIRDYKTQYFAVLTFSLFLLITNFLPTVANRYLYFTQPFIILLAAFAFDKVLEYLYSLSKTNCLASRCAIILTTIFFCLFIFAGINTNVLNLYKEGYLPNWSLNMIKFPDYKISERFKEIVSSDDVVISAMPHTYEYYNNGMESDYFLQANTIAVVVLDPQSLPYYKDKYIMSNVLRNLDELKSVLYNNNRVWFFGISSFLFEARNQEEIFNFITKFCRNVAKTHNGDVYLWDRGKIPQSINIDIPKSNY